MSKAVIRPDEVGLLDLLELVSSPIVMMEAIIAASPSYFGVKLHKAAWGRESFAGLSGPQGPGTIYPREHIDFCPRLGVDILVRKEYEECLQFLRDEHQACLEENRSGRVIITGQSGIGKTLFLVYALIQRLLNREPTAFQMSSRVFLLFDERGVRRVRDDDLSCAVLGPAVWALFDGDLDDVGVPGKAFSHSKAFVVMASMSDASRWKRWKRQHGADVWVMDIWSEAELRQLFERISPTMVERAIQLSKTYGPSARDLVVLLRDYRPYGRRESCTEEDENIDTGVWQLLHYPGVTLPKWRRHDFTSDEASAIFFRRPALADGDPGQRGRTSTSFAVPTAHILDKLVDGLLAKAPTAQLEFLDAMKAVSAMRRTADDLFKVLAHARLTSGDVTLQCQVETGAPVVMAPVRELIVGTVQAISETATAFYWPSDLPGIDAIVFDSHHVFYLQTTVGKTHKKGDLCDVLTTARANLHPTVKERPAYFVLIGIAECDAAAAAKSLAGKTAELGVSVCRAVLPLAFMTDVDLKRLRPSELMMLTD